MPPSTSTLRAGEVMDRAAALMNDAAKTDYTYVAVLPYLNMAIDELMENLEESNASPTNKTSDPIVCAIGVNKLTPQEDPTTPHYPYDLMEIQEVGERNSGTTDPFLPLTRKEFLDEFPASDSLLFWMWEDQMIKFNPNGATSARDVQLKYIRQPFMLAENEASLIGGIGSRSYLSYKTAAICAMFIGENPQRAEVLDAQAEKALERMLGKDSKGRQQIFTRRRPFRSGYKARYGYY
jgi:hypothetical protein